jgi:hypothetical protein
MMSVEDLEVLRDFFEGASMSHLAVHVACPLGDAHE